jgi:N-acetylglucosaminyldiphosphoundecaprenol N-acetyl-beta-D-mannosaminyltransferase
LLPHTALDGLHRRRRLRLAWLRASGRVLTFTTAALRRVLDVATAAILSAATGPIAVAAMIAAASRGKPPLLHRTYLGRWMKPIEVGVLPGAPRGLRHIPRLWAIVRGDMSLVGPGLMALDDARGLTAVDLERFQVRPGLADLFMVRSAANIAFDGHSAAAVEQVHTASLFRDLGLLVRALPAAVMRGRKVVAPHALSILGVRMDNWTMHRAVSWIVDAPHDGPPEMLAFVNPDCLNIAWRDDGYREILSKSSVVLPDGIGIHYACRMLGTHLAANVNGTDLFPRLCDTLETRDQSVFLLGGRPGVTDALVERLAQRWPRLRVVGHHDRRYDQLIPGRSPAGCLRRTSPGTVDRRPPRSAPRPGCDRSWRLVRFLLGRYPTGTTVDARARVRMDLAPATGAGTDVATVCHRQSTVLVARLALERIRGFSEPQPSCEH